MTVPLRDWHKHDLGLQVMLAWSTDLVSYISLGIQAHCLSSWPNNTTEFGWRGLIRPVGPGWSLSFHHLCRCSALFGPPFLVTGGDFVEDGPILSSRLGTEDFLVVDDLSDTFRICSLLLWKRRKIPWLLVRLADRVNIAKLIGCGSIENAEMLLSYINCD